MTIVKSTDCQMFFPKADNSVICRHCAGPFYTHSAKARGFDSTLEMQRASYTDHKLIQWMKGLAPTNKERLAKIEAIVNSNVTAADVPSNEILIVVQQILTQLIIEGELSLCRDCKQPLEKAEELICFDCRVAAVMATEGEDITAGVARVQAEHAPPGTDVTAVLDGTIVPPGPAQ